MGDYLYGDSDDSGVPFCAELMTGEIKWKKRGSGKGSASNRRGRDGHLATFTLPMEQWRLATASPEEYAGDQLVSHSGNRGPAELGPHPVILDGKLYLREQDSILCYDIRKALEIKPSAISFPAKCRVRCADHLL